MKCIMQGNKTSAKNTGSHDPVFFVVCRKLFSDQFPRRHDIGESLLPIFDQVELTAALTVHDMQDKALTDLPARFVSDELARLPFAMRREWCAVVFFGLVMTAHRIINLSSASLVPGSRVF